MNYKELVVELLSNAGITLNGDKDYDIQVKNDKFYKRVISDGSLGLGESYMDGWWAVRRVDKFIAKILSANLDERISFKKIILFLKAKLTNKQKSRSYHIGQWHYDIGNDLYKKMLDKNLQYSCGYWEKAQNLDDAQKDKLKLICQKLKLKKGMSLLDIGCGWGTLARYAAKKYGAKVVGVTVSKEQAKFAKKINQNLPVEIRIQDYREINKKFDRTVSVGMIEHVGYKNYHTYMEVVSKSLKENGIFLLQTIGSNISNHHGDAWMDKYIFPDGMLPSIKQLAKAYEGRLIMEDLQNFGSYYDKTLMHWHKKFLQAWPTLQKSYNEKFKKMWEYYLLSCAAAFRIRKIQIWQIVLTKKYDGIYSRSQI